MSALFIPAAFTITPFDWPDWRALWQARHRQLAEGGIQVDLADIGDRPSPEDDDTYEWDFHHLDQVYLTGAGGFWLARCDGEPVGYVGAQDLGGCVELRRMYVAAAYRRRGIGRALVQALIDHCRAGAVRAVELWTAPDGPGRSLYLALGFRPVAVPGVEYRDLAGRTRYTPGKDEIRLRLDLPAQADGAVSPI